MKYLFLLFVISTISINMFGQNSPGQLLAAKIAQKMTDSLLLNEQQKDQVFAVNMQLHERKMALRKQYQDHTLLTTQLQLEENRRDSLYQNVLTPDQYRLYRRKKAALIVSN